MAINAHVRSKYFTFPHLENIYGEEIQNNNAHKTTDPRTQLKKQKHESLPSYLFCRYTHISYFCINLFPKHKTIMS